MHGLVLRSTRGDDERKLRENSNNNNAVTILSIQKTGCYFTTVPLQRISSRIATIDSEYNTVQTRIVSQAIDVAASFVPLLESASALIAIVDVLVAFAVAVVTSPAGYCRPDMVDWVSACCCLLFCVVISLIEIIQCSYKYCAVHILWLLLYLCTYLYCLLF